METLYLSLSVVFPLICLLSLGYLLTVFKLFDDEFLKKLNLLNFEVFVPFLLFTSIYMSNFNLKTSLPMIVFSLISTCLIFLILFVFIPKITKEKEERSVLIQAIYRGNIVLFGLPITASIYGIENLSVTSVMIAFTIPLYNFLGVFVLQVYSESKTSFTSVARGLSKNPLIISTLLAFLFINFEIKIPNLVENTMLDIAKIATPLSLIILGGTFKMTDLKKYKKSLIIGIIGRLIIVPLIFIPLSLVLGFRGMQLTALLVMFITPTAVTSFTMAQAMGANSELAGQFVVMTSILSVISIFIYITVLQYAQVL